jgi:hypothetical protein
MQLSPEIKEFLQHAGKVLVIEDGQPKFVLSGFQEYMDVLRGSKKTSEKSPHPEIIGQRGEKSVEKEENPYLQNARKHEDRVSDINQELANLVNDDLFAPLPDEQAGTVSFYRELE